MDIKMGRFGRDKGETEKKKNSLSMIGTMGYALEQTLGETALIWMNNREGSNTN